MAIFEGLSHVHVISDCSAVSVQIKLWSDDKHTCDLYPVKLSCKYRSSLVTFCTTPIGAHSSMFFFFKNGKRRQSLYNVKYTLPNAFIISLGAFVLMNVKV